MIGYYQLLIGLKSFLLNTSVNWLKFFESNRLIKRSPQDLSKFTVEPRLTASMCNQDCALQCTAIVWLLVKILHFWNAFFQSNAFNLLSNLIELLLIDCTSNDCTPIIGRQWSTRFCKQIGDFCCLCVYVCVCVFFWKTTASKFRAAFVLCKVTLLKWPY